VWEGFPRHENAAHQAPDDMENVTMRKDADPMPGASLTWPYPRVLAHRGGGTLAPENTLAAFEVGRRFGFRGAEFDVMLTADDIPVLMHDTQCGRTVPGRAHIARMGADRLRALDAGSWFGPAYSGERVPLLREVIGWCRDHNVWMNIEIKPSSRARAYQTGCIAAQLTRWLWLERSSNKHLAQAPAFSSFMPAALMGARDAAPEFARGLLVNRVPKDWRKRMQLVEATALHVNQQFLQSGHMQRFNKHGVPVMAYTVNDPRRANELFDWGVSCVCTDRLDLVSPSLVL
jgi:glycerophosphoryl diester phosphodiesterase